MTAISEESVTTRSHTIHPEYARTALLDEVRRAEYGYLDREGHVYLDYTGAGLAAVSQYRSHAERLADGCFGNPHSANPASQASTDLVEGCRLAVLDYFKADPREYTAVFTANATAACRLVGEAYQFDSDNRFLLTFDNHNSVNGIREHARRARARVAYVPGSGPELRVDESVLEDALRGAGARGRGQRAGCSPSRDRATSPGCAIRCAGSQWRSGTDSTCCWTRRPSSRRTGSTCPWCTRSSSQ